MQIELSKKWRTNNRRKFAAVPSASDKNGGGLLVSLTSYPNNSGTGPVFNQSLCHCQDCPVLLGNTRRSQPNYAVPQTKGPREPIHPSNILVRLFPLALESLYPQDFTHRFSPFLHEVDGEVPVRQRDPTAPQSWSKLPCAGSRAAQRWMGALKSLFRVYSFRCVASRAKNTYAWTCAKKKERNLLSLKISGEMRMEVAEGVPWDLGASIYNRQNYKKRTSFCHFPRQEKRYYLADKEPVYWIWKMIITDVTLPEKEVPTGSEQVFSWNFLTFFFF